jgi:hypothetical protein
MAYIPFAPETGAKYTVTASDGTIATFNDSTDPNYVGILTDVTGLDSPDVRESADVTVAADGGWHGNFYYGRRPMAFTGAVVNVPDTTVRAARLDLLRRASNAMRSDSIISWQPTAIGAVPMQTWARLQNIRYSGAWVKTFQLGMVSNFAPLFSVTSHTSASGTNLTVENQGSWPSYPVVTITGPTSGTRVIVVNVTTGLIWETTLGGGFTLSTGQQATIDMFNHQFYLTATGASLNSYVDWAASNWFYLRGGTPSVAGTNNITLTGAASMSVAWRDAWI